jgi:putative hydrolase of the HAD superfamily
MNIRAIFCDIDDTLFPTSEFASRARKNAAMAMVRAGICAKPTAILSAIEKEVEMHGSNYSGHFDHACQKFRCINREKTIAAGIVAYHNTKLGMKPYPDAAKTLAQLQKRGYLLYVASEGRPIKQWDKLIRLGLSQYFSKAFVTTEKSKAFYVSLAKAVGCKPCECLMVGNRLDKDITPAKLAGFQTAIFKGRKSEAEFSINSLSRLIAILK